MNLDLSSVRQEVVAELESILESDEAYGSNLQILTYTLKEDVINGKFKDSWNNRVYEFIIDIDGISYKPAAKLDSFSADELPARFDAYSKGYSSLLKSGRFDRYLTGKRVKKPKCGKQGYGCGYSCISLLKTCQILSSGKKAGTNQGKAIGQQRLNKLMELSEKLYLAGDTKKAALASTIAGNISKVRTKYNAGGQGLIAERALAKQKEQEVKTLTKPQEISIKSQEKQPVKLEFEPTKSTDKTTISSANANQVLSNKEFKNIDNIETRKKLNQWIKMNSDLKKLSKRRGVKDIDKERVQAATEVIESMIEMIGNKHNNFGGVVDSNGKLQAAYIYEEREKDYYIEYLASAPWNCLESHPDKKTGAGTSAMEALIRVAISKNKGQIELESMQNAVPFYYKIGFKKQRGAAPDYPIMNLDKESAQKFLETQKERHRKDAGLILSEKVNDLTELESLEEQSLGLFTVPQDVHRRVIKKIESRSINN